MDDSIYNYQPVPIPEFWIDEARRRGSNNPIGDARGMYLDYRDRTEQNTPPEYR